MVRTLYYLRETQFCLGQIVHSLSILHANNILPGLLYTQSNFIVLYTWCISKKVSLYYAANTFIFWAPPPISYPSLNSAPFSTFASSSSPRFSNSLSVFRIRFLTQNLIMMSWPNLQRNSGAALSTHRHYQPTILYLLVTLDGHISWRWLRTVVTTPLEFPCVFTLTRMSEETF